MSDALTTFFDAWSETDAKTRHGMIANATTDSFTYSDPRSGARLSGTDAVAEYVGMFSANAAGWTATTGDVTEVNGYLRASVIFSGKGPDGSEMSQTGLYFGDVDGKGRLTMLAGFVG